jgi:putative Mg2+ transporter-C (MgtC) family protein
VGLERELHGKPAGLRTNMFICLGSALFTILSSEMAAASGGDPTRVASQLIPGIGFIGAGSIIRARGSVLGLTTAATIFVLASIGMAVGAGRYATALFAALLILAGLGVLGWIERRLELKKELRTYRVCGPELAATATAVFGITDEHNLTLHRLATSRQGDVYEVTFDLDTSAEQHTAILRALTEKKLTCGVTSAGLAEGE